MNTEKPDPRLDSEGKPLPIFPCPKCGSPNDAATSCDETDREQNVRPRPGDISVCIRCASILQFQEDLTVKIISMDETGADDDTKFQIARLQQKIQQIKWDEFKNDRNK